LPDVAGAGGAVREPEGVPLAPMFTALEVFGMPRDAVHDALLRAVAELKGPCALSALLWCLLT
jgi:hypothetical protein